ncbi:MAG: hypothetical protein A4E71_01379 [Smithella sp. PtaU1.Bin162]|nr:MAG: hypothetical protein A4E71_01379 [Smithella sp. PtaU1.Bin162]
MILLTKLKAVHKFPKNDRKEEIKGYGKVD